MWIVVFLLLLIVLGILLLSPSGNGGSGNSPKSRGRVSFYAKGMDAGFSLSEINLLWNAACHAQLDNPPAIYGSVEELDKALNQIAGNRKFSERDGSDPETHTLKKLFDYRKKVEMNRPRYHSGLVSTRNISIGQKLSLRADGIGVYTSTVVDNTQDYMTITIPAGKPLPPGFSWRAGKLNIYFWRKDDAGYFFQSRLVDNYYDHKKLHFHLYHSDNILRSQKRRSVRSVAEIPARFYPLKSLDEANQWMEASPGNGCLITDVSEEGAALRIGGHIRKNKPFKLQFKIRNELVVVSGVVKRVEYDASKNESHLNVEFLPVGDNTRMIILSYVFDIDRQRAKEGMAKNREVLDSFSGDDTSPAEGRFDADSATLEDADDVVEVEELGELEEAEGIEETGEPEIFGTLEEADGPEEPEEAEYIDELEEVPEEEEEAREALAELESVP